MKTKWINLFLCIICFLLGIFLWKGCEDRKDLRSELKQIKSENAELTLNIQQISQENDSLMLDISDYENQISDLETSLKKAKNRKELIVERVKYVEVTNDTIRDLMVLNQVNDTIIRNLEKLESIKDSTILSLHKVIQNDKEIQDQLKREIALRNESIQAYNKELLREKKKKNFWQCTTVGASLFVIAVLI